MSTTNSALLVQGNEKHCFTQFTCSSIRLGSYNLNGSSFIVQVSRKSVLLKSVCIRKNSELNNGAFQFDLHFPVKELLEFAVHFHPTHPAIFLTFTPELSQNFSSLLNLDKNGSYWNSQSQKEIEKRIILIPCKLDVSVASAIQEIFSLNSRNNVQGFRELTVAEATRLFEISVLPSLDEERYLNTFNRAVKSFSVASPTNLKKNETKIQIFVKIFGREIITLLVDRSDTVACVKDKIQEKRGLPSDQQCLMYAGKQIGRFDHLTLSDFGIQKESTLELLFLTSSKFQ